MRSALERLGRRWWSGGLGLPGTALSILLAPLSWLWGAVTAVRNARHDREGGATVAGLTVLSVGNLAVGGTGKTPVAAWLARACKDAGSNTAVLTNGYARDEELLHRLWTPGIPVYADRDRVAAARRARADGADVAVLDDGFQHRRLARAIDLVVLAAEQAFPGPLLPRGPYRERPCALRRATAVVITRRTATLDEARALEGRVTALRPDVPTACARFAGDAWLNLEGEPREPPDGDVLAVAAVGRPETFAAAVRAAVPGGVELAPFPDHHEYTHVEVDRLVARAAGRAIVVTEKDAVKLVESRERLPDVRVLRQALVWDWGDAGLLTLAVPRAEPGT